MIRGLPELVVGPEGWTCASDIVHTLDSDVSWESGLILRAICERWMLIEIQLKLHACF